MITTYIALGSNLDDPLAQVSRAMAELDRMEGATLQAASSLYRSAPMGPADQPDYINAVVALETALSPHALLDALQAIEQAHGRQRGPQRWGPRTLDLDVLLYGEETINDQRLTIPHPGISERAFVLFPLQEIVAPDFIIPGHGSLQELLPRVAADRPERLPDA
ncbi:MAG: 2-amino-4-hydroxy-6-hydroxymethyldihydropteridine diphosphokinase [Thiohalophilus sp.]|uniref:2-amino-4-hydroxy-6- hydroxymethyldihydropteridine diphosphokinase n=1 Tax=Thiohalophilus sp. TaxID=3028392 RepID=UPI00286FB2F6|nr:2-amino-4-hydroxy-6-hydroxymethyldihydropteridine diphosphokinase [Thiohalophilus sp.]MDR9435678.1 2-amino-4-hydroxy-6-hydroxymethyldihydropteridine diphosphokinase [Thiohalophilus sp.]